MPASTRRRTSQQQAYAEEEAARRYARNVLSRRASEREAAPEPEPEPMAIDDPKIETTGSLEDCADDPDMEDEYICKKVHDLRDTIAKFAGSVGPDPQDDVTILERLLKVDNRTLLRYIERLCLGGNAEHYARIMSSSARTSLITAIISQVLKHEVFDSLYFGGASQLQEALHDLERGQVLHDGFFRTKARAEAIARDKHSSAEDLRKAEIKVVLQLWQLLRPFYAVDAQAAAEGDFKRQLKEMVRDAAVVSRAMRAKGDVIYFWPATFKDETFEEKRMECINLSNMFTLSPWKQGSAKEGGYPTIMPGMESHDEAIVLIVSFPGLQSFRKGGSALGEESLREEVARRAEGRKEVEKQSMDEDELKKEAANGLRTRVVVKALVHLQWGKQHLLTKQAGTSTHMNAVKNKDTAKYEADYEGDISLSSFGDALPDVPQPSQPRVQTSSNARPRAATRASRRRRTSPEEEEDVSSAYPTPDGSPEDADPHRRF